MLEPIPETANDVGVMATIANGGNATDVRGSARHFYFFRCLRLTYEVGIGILIVELSKESGSFRLWHLAGETFPGRVERPRRVLVESRVTHGYLNDLAVELAARFELNT